MPEHSSSLPLLLFGTPLTHPNIVYATRFLAPDPVVVLDYGDHVSLWVSPLEAHRAAIEATGCTVHSTEEIQISSLLGAAGSETEMWPRLVHAVLIAECCTAVRVDSTFPLGIADTLRDHDIHVTVDWTVYLRERRIKTPEEISALREVERIGLGGLEAALSLLRATSTKDGLLYHEGAPLTGSDLVHAVESYYLAHDCITVDSICCGSPECADPHRTTSPVIRANLPIVLDLYPYHRTSRYWADLTRTVVVGDPPEAIWKMWEAVKQAQREALDMVRPGVNARDIHRHCCDVFRDHGYGSLTPPYNEISSQARFIHGTGHGVGLEIHEFPRVSDPDVILEAGDVITIEPGLYDPHLGGIRIEDLVTVTDQGMENLTPFPKDLVLVRS
ncbi:MAG: M24 family metallopeptidase [Candidatus Dormibacteria bacterium]